MTKVAKLGWFERQTERLLSTSHPSVVCARPEYGVPYLFHSLAAASYSTLWITLREDDDAIAIGNRLSDAARRTFEATLFGTGMPFSYGLDFLAGLTGEMGTLTLLVDCAHLHPQFCEASLLAAKRSHYRLKIILAGYSDRAEWQALTEQSHVTQIGESDLEVRSDEARVMLAEHNLKYPEGREMLIQQAAGVYERLVRLQLDAGDGPTPVRPTADGLDVSRFAPRRSPSLDDLISMADWKRAFAVAVSTDSSRARYIITNAADAYFSHGQIIRFLHLVERLLRDYPNDPGVLYWWFQAHVGLGRQAEVEERIARYLEREAKTAPNLAAAYASVYRPPNALELAGDALACARSPETAASVGFLQVIEGKLDQGIELLREAHDGYRADRRHHRAIQAAISIGSAYVQRGDYRRALVWAESSVEEVQRRGIREELVRLSALNLLAYSLLLIGDVEAGEEALKRVHVSLEGSLPPTMEGLVSTLGDYALIGGRPVDALNLYRHVHNELGAQLPGYSARQLVRALLFLGRDEDARAVVAVAGEKLPVMDQAEQANYEVAQLMLQSHNGEVCDSRLQDLARSPAGRADALVRAESALAIAAAHLRRGDETKAVNVVRDNAEVLSNLGRAGWQLHSPTGVDVDKLRRFVADKVGSSRRLLVLGVRTMEEDGRGREVSLRFAELFSILALAPDGYSGEALLYELYGDGASMSTLKATISRARRILKVEAGPYRLSTPLYVDVVHLEELLRVGHLREALELYKGPLLPESEAPGVRRARERIDEAIRQAVLHAGEADLALRLARKFPDDLELWEKARELTPKDDPAYPLIRARIHRIRGEWGL